MSCSIEKVFAPNGEESILYDDITKIVHSAKRAMTVYLEIKDLDIAGLDTDRNGEVLLSEIIEDVSSLSPESIARFYSSDSDEYDFSISTGVTPEIISRLRILSKQILEAKRKAEAFGIEDSSGIIDKDLLNFFLDRADKLTEDKQTLIEAQSISSIIDVAKSQLGLANSIADKETVSDSELMWASTLAHSWLYDVTSGMLNDVQLDPENDVNVLFQAISGEAQAVRNKILDIMRANMRSSIILETGIDPGDLKSFVDLGSGKFSGSIVFNTLDASKMDNQVLQKLAELQANANRNQAGKITQVSNELTKLSEGVNVNNLLQIDDQGRIAGIVSPYSYRFYEELNRIFSVLDKSLAETEHKFSKEARMKRSMANKKYYTQRKAIEVVIDIRFILVKGFYTPSFKTKEAYLKYLNAELGEDVAKRKIDEAILKYREYKKLRTNAKIRIEGEALSGIDRKEGETIEQYIKSKLKLWELINSPFTYLNEYFSTGTRQYMNREGHNFVASYPRTTDYKGNPTNYLDPNFEKLTDKERALLDKIMEIMSEMKSRLPSNISVTLGDNFLPYVSATFTEEIRKNGALSMISYLNRQITESITGSKSTLNDPENNSNSREQVPIRFIQPLSKEETQSSDLIRIVEMFTAMAMNYSFKTTIEDTARIAQLIINESKEIERQGGRPVTVTDGDGNVSYRLTENAPKNLAASADYAFKSGVLGKKRVENEGERDIPVFSLNPIIQYQKRKKAKEIYAKRDALEEKLEDKKISEDDYKKEMDVLEEEFSKLSGKNLVLSGIANAVLGYSQFKGMGYNGVAGLTNLSFGFVTNYIHASSRLDFNSKELGRAISIILKSRTARKSKAANLVKVFNVLFEVTEIGYGKEDQRRKYTLLSNLRPYEIQRRTEFTIQGAAMIASMLNEKITDLKGKERTLYEAYNEDGSWNEKEFGEAGEWDSENLGPKTVNKHTKFRNKVIQMNKQLHGNYDPNSGMPIKRFVAGRGIMMFKSWLPESLAWRFQKSYYDRQLGREVKGRYITAKDIFKDYGGMGIAKSVLAYVMGKEKLVIDGKEVSTIDYANMQSNVTEAGIMLALAAAGIMLKMSLFGDDDDDEFQTYAGRILLSQIYRVQSDLTFYVNPMSAYQLASNPLPFLTSFTSAVKVINASKEYLSDPDYSGDELWEMYTKNVPGLNQVSRFYYQAKDKMDNEEELTNFIAREIFN